MCKIRDQTTQGDVTESMNTHLIIQAKQKIVLLGNKPEQNSKNILSLSLGDCYALQNAID